MTLLRLLDTLDYRILLPLAARSRGSLRRLFLTLRARRLELRGADWRREAGDVTLAQRQDAALALINPHRPASPLSAADLRRAWLDDELCAMELIQGRFLDRLDVPPLSAEHTLWITAHYGPSITAAAALGRRGRPISAIASSIIAAPGVPPAVTAFYLAKYRALERHFHGGRIRYRETHMKALLQDLRQGHDLIVLSDLPAQPSEPSLPVTLFGRPAALTAGAAKLAAAHAIPLQAYLAVPTASGYRLELGPRLRGRSIDDFIPAYRFLAETIERDPRPWWALDQLV